MKARANSLFLVTAFFAAIHSAACGGSGSPPIPPPPTGGFSNASLKGQYAFSMSGSNGANFFGRIGSFTADGNGTIKTGIEDVNIAGGGTQTITFAPGTSYSVQADGRGTINLTGTGPLVFSITMLSPKQGLIVETDGVATTSGTFILQDPSTFSGSSLSGPFVFDVSGLDGALNPDSIVGQFVANGSAAGGTFNSGLIDENDAAQLVSAAPFTGGTFQMDSTNGPTSGRGTLTFTANGTAFNYIFYIVNASRIRMMESSTALTIGDAQAQSSVPTSNTNFNGNFAFLLTGSSTGASTITRIGRATANGSGGLTGVYADTNDDGLVAQVPHGNLTNTTYSIDTANAGTGRGTLSFTDSSLGTYSFVFYLASSSGGVIQDVTVKQVADGAIQLQTGAPFTNATVAGDYGFNFSGLSTNSSTFTTAEEDYVGHLNLSSSGSNNATGAVDFSEFSSNQGVFTNIVVSGNGLTIGGDGTTSTGTRNALSLKINGSPSSTLNFVAYIVNSQTMFVAGTDSNRTISGTLTLQAP